MPKSPLLQLLKGCYSRLILPAFARSRRPGLTALVTVMLLGGVALFTALVIALRGAGETDLALTTLHGAQADALLIGCAEEGLLRLSHDPFNALTDMNFPIGNGDCTITTTQAPSSTSYDMIVTVKRQRSLKSAKIKVLLPAMQILSWESIQPTP